VVLIEEVRLAPRRVDGTPRGHRPTLASWPIWRSRARTAAPWCAGRPPTSGVTDAATSAHAARERPATESYSSTVSARSPRRRGTHSGSRRTAQRSRTAGRCVGRC